METAKNMLVKEFLLTYVAFTFAVYPVLIRLHYHWSFDLIYRMDLCLKNIYLLTVSVLYGVNRLNFFGCQIIICDDIFAKIMENGQYV